MDPDTLFTFPMEQHDTIIIGAGLSGIYAAFLLAKKGESFIMLEARDRVGGRILCPAYNGYTADLGPSWYWPEINPRIAALVEMLALTGYPQYDAGNGRFQTMDGRVQTISRCPMEPEAWRISGGMIALVDGLQNTLPENTILLNHPVYEIEKKGSHAIVNVGKPGHPPCCQYQSSRIILALPPRLAAATILFTPDLSCEMTQAMLKTSTWMAGQAKFFALYNTADWRDAGFSGQAFSQSGPLGEIHDGSNHAGGPFGLTGFVGIPAAQRRNKQAVIQATLQQLHHLYGEKADRPKTVFYTDWALERYTATEYDQRAAHDHPRYHPPSGNACIWDGILCFAGSETSDAFGGYLEGALASAERSIRTAFP